MDNQCIDMQRGAFDINQQSRPNYDSCYEEIRTKQSRENANYFMRSFNSCNMNAVEDLAYNQQRIIFKNGYGSIGLNGSKIEDNSKIRHPKLTNFRNINQLDGLPYQTSPDLSRGKGDICVESFLKSAEDTYQQKPCNNLAGVTIDRFTPMVDSLKQNIQNPSHIIPENVDVNWVRGGSHSRQTVRQAKYLEKCGYKHNGKFWTRN